MEPRKEFSDLVDRSGKLVNTALLLLVMFAHLVVAAGTLFCMVFVTVFSFGSVAVDKMTARITVRKGDVDDALEGMAIVDPVR